MIQVSPKLCRPKIKNRYVPPGYEIDIYEGVFDFEQYGRQYTDPKKRG